MLEPGTAASSDQRGRASASEELTRAQDAWADTSVRFSGIAVRRSTDGAIFVRGPRIER